MSKLSHNLTPVIDLLSTLLDLIKRDVDCCDQLSDHGIVELLASKYSIGL